MKAKEVLKQYAEGRRDFQKLNLRGQSFKEKNLSGANFSYCQIQGTNFSQANLTGANFTGAKAGLQKRVVGSLSFLALAIILVYGVCSASFCEVIIQQITRIFSHSDFNTQTLEDIFSLIALLIIYTVAYLRGLDTELGKLALIFAIPIAGVGAVQAVVRDTIYTGISAIVIAGTGVLSLA